MPCNLNNYSVKAFCGFLPDPNSSDYFLYYSFIGLEEAKIWQPAQRCQLRSILLSTRLIFCCAMTSAAWKRVQICGRYSVGPY